MLQSLDNEVRECLARAQDCAERAKEARDPRERLEWLAFETGYLKLVQSIQFRRRLSLFTQEQKKRLIKARSAFEPEAVDCMVKAYESALSTLGLANCDDPATRLLAQKIIEVAETGERDPARISTRAIQELGHTRNA